MVNNSTKYTWGSFYYYYLHKQLKVLIFLIPVAMYLLAGPLISLFVLKLDFLTFVAASFVPFVLILPLMIYLLLIPFIQYSSGIKECHYEFSEECFKLIERDKSSSSTYQIEYRTITRVVEGKRMFYLFTQDKKPLFISKSGFTCGSAAELKNLITKKTGILFDRS